MIFALTSSGEWLGIGGIGLAAVGAFFGVLATMWSKAKDVLWRFISLVIRRVEVPTQAAHDAITAY